MKSKKKKIYLFLGGFLMLSLLAFGGARIFLFAKIRAAIEKEATALRNEGYTVTYDSLVTSSWANEVAIANVLVKFPKTPGTCGDTTSSIAAAHFKITGVKILPLLLHRKIALSEIFIDAPDVTWVRSPKAKKTSEKKSSETEKKLNGLIISNIHIQGAKISVRDSSSCKVSLTGLFNFAASDIAITDPETAGIKTMVRSAGFSAVELGLPGAFYTLKMNSALFSGDASTFVIDSILIMPDYNKSLFMQKTGHQTDRIASVIKDIKIKGIQLSPGVAPAFHASDVSFAFVAEIYRDKRLPGLGDAKKLPSESLRAIGADIQIDSIHLKPSRIIYEEFQPGGDTPGMIRFDDLQAQVSNLSTKSARDMVMHAQAKFMGAGILKADFTFPADPTKPYSAKGSLSGFNLALINPMLTQAAHAEIKSGHLKDMPFHFVYNGFRSDGELSIDYSDLKVAVLQKNSKDNSENKLITLILNAIVKKDMNKNKGDNKGTILFFYDHRHSVFNYWWKSLLSGIKSIYNLDKIMDTHHSKPNKKK